MCVCCFLTAVDICSTVDRAKFSVLYFSSKMFALQVIVHNAVHTSSVSWWLSVVYRNACGPVWVSAVSEGRRRSWRQQQHRQLFPWNNCRFVSFIFLNCPKNSVKIQTCWLKLIPAVTKDAIFEGIDIFAVVVFVVLLPHSTAFHSFKAGCYSVA